MGVRRVDFGAVPGDIAFVGDDLAVLADDGPGVEPGL
jgi:hypothetical protein